MKILILFFILSLINVIFSTEKSLVTIKGTKITASLVNGGYFAFYNIMLVYTVADFPMWQKCIITFVCNVIGVYVVKGIEEKTRKEKMWKIEMCLPKAYLTSSPDDIKQELNDYNIPCNYTEVGNWIMFNCYCQTCDQSDFTVTINKKNHGKISAYESQALII